MIKQTETSTSLAMTQDRINCIVERLKYIRGAFGGATTVAGIYEQELDALICKQMNLYKSKQY
jgi:hypothetical protein